MTHENCTNSYLCVYKWFHRNTEEFVMTETIRPHSLKCLHYGSAHKTFAGPARTAASTSP